MNMNQPKPNPLWGYLVPLLSAVQHENHGKQANVRKGGHVAKECRENHQRHSLALPGTFGREDLLLPFWNTCPTCCRRPRPTDANEESPHKRRRECCKNCQSIQNTARVTPRKNFLHFHPLGHNIDEPQHQQPNQPTEEKRLFLTISGNSSQIVHLSSFNSKKCASHSSNNASPHIKQRHKWKSLKNVEVNDGDELSLHWNFNEKGQELESEVESFSDPVVRFRFARQSNAEDPMIISSSNHNPVAAKGDEHPVHSPKIKLEDEIQNNDETAISNKPSSVVATVLKNESITNIQPLRDLDMKVEAIGSSLKLSEGHFHDESVSNKNLVKLNTDNLDLEKHSNVNEGDKTDTDNNDKNCQRDNEQNKCKSGVETTQHDCDISVKNDVTNIDAVESDSNTEEEESEPLTLPNQFFTSSSFDSPQRSTEHLKISEKNHYVDHATTEIVKKEINECCSSVTPLKRNLPDKMKPMDIEYGECNNFPIENNDPKCLGTSASISLMKEKRDENDTSTLVPLATLTRDQLKQLHRETNSARLNPSETPAPDCTLPSQALRYAVLSLTLALTSDASSWDANFLRDDTDVLHKNEAKKQKMNQLQSPMGANQKGVQQWMPRLLQGTTVVMRKTLS